MIMLTSWGNSGETNILNYRISREYSVDVLRLLLQDLFYSLVLSFKDKDVPLANLGVALLQMRPIGLDDSQETKIIPSERWVERSKHAGRRPFLVVELYFRCETGVHPSCHQSRFRLMWRSGGSGINRM